MKQKMIIKKPATLLFVLLIFSVIKVTGQSTADYLANHSIDITNEKTLLTSKFPDKQFYRYQLFLAGEIHGIQKGQDVDYTLLTLLNQKANVTTYVAEMDFAKAYFLNQYLQTGDEKLIDDVFSDWIEQDVQWANKDFQNKIKKIRACNLSVKPAYRIHFEGIDQIQNPRLAAHYLKLILADKRLRGIRHEADPLIMALQQKNDSLIVNEATVLLKKLPGLTNLKTSADLVFAIKNCALINLPREMAMYQNFKELFNIHGWQNVKLYGFFGFAHILGAKANNGKSVSFSFMIAHDNEMGLNGKIAAIGLLYVDSKMTLPNAALPVAWRQKGTRFTVTDKYNHDGPLVKFDGIEDFKAVTKPGSLTLFDLGAPGSPYLNKSLEIRYAAMMPPSQRLLFNEPGKYITDYLRYVILVRNSEATMPVIP